MCNVQCAMKVSLRDELEFVEKRKVRNEYRSKNCQQNVRGTCPSSVIARQCAHCRGNPTSWQVLPVLVGSPHQSADWFAMTVFEPGASVVFSSKVGAVFTSNFSFLPKF